MKTFGLVVPKGAGHVFEGHVGSLLANNTGLKQIIKPLLDAWRGHARPCCRIEQTTCCFSPRVSNASCLRRSLVSARLASSFSAAIEDPAKFRTSRSVGAWIGST
ncbi:hypothetical protein ABIB90_007883 [Bradyrhizobium sp. JR4.1]